MDGTKGVTDGDSGNSKVGRRRFLGGVGMSGLAAAGVIFGFAKPALALVSAGCCTLCCNPSQSMSQCESGSYYVWSCSESGGFLYCDCCEHNSPCSYGCNSTHFSSYSCQY